MPNWCEGTLKVRGGKDDLINFLKNGMYPVDFFGNKKEVEIKEDETYLNITASVDCFYLEGTRRGFIEENDIWFDYEQGILALEYKQAWCIDTGQLAEISKKFNVDLKIYAYERGMSFNQDIEIHKGIIVKNNEIKFDDYMWECTNPNIGG